MLLTAQQAADQLGISTRSLRRRRQQDPAHLGAIRQGRQWLYPLAQLHKITRPVDHYRAAIIKKYGLEEHHDGQNLHSRQPRPATDPQ